MNTKILPSDEEIIINNTQDTTSSIIKFDKLSIRIYGHAKYNRNEMTYSINSDYRRRNIDLSMYINAINDYFISYSVYKNIKRVCKKFCESVIKRV